jgi:hypothetical protein
MRPLGLGKLRSMRTLYVLVLLAFGLLSMGGDCRQTGEVCETASDCTGSCTEFCGEQSVRSSACESNFCVCECEEMGTGGSGGAAGSGGMGGSGGAGGAAGTGGNG